MALTTFYSSLMSQICRGSYLAAVSRWAALPIEAVSKPSEFGRLTSLVCAQPCRRTDAAVTRMMHNELTEL